MKSEFKPEPETKAAAMKVSAIIPTKDRPSELANVTRDLLSQTSLPAEIVIIDQSPDDAGRRLVRSLLRSGAGCPRFSPAALRAGPFDQRRQRRAKSRDGDSDGRDLAMPR